MKRTHVYGGLSVAPVQSASKVDTTVGGSWNVTHFDVLHDNGITYRWFPNVGTWWYATALEKETNTWTAVPGSHDNMGIPLALLGTVAHMAMDSGITVPWTPSMDNITIDDEEIEHRVMTDQVTEAIYAGLCDLGVDMADLKILVNADDTGVCISLDSDDSHRYTEMEFGNVSHVLDNPRLYAEIIKANLGEDSYRLPSQMVTKTRASRKYDIWMRRFWHYDGNIDRFKKT